MTKEEFIRNAIENRKEDKMSCYNIKCTDCPYEGAKCGANVIYDLLDCIIELESKTETNLEHFRGNVAFDKTNGIVLINLINGWKNNYSRPHEEAIDWLLAPYEEPKPLYLLRQFEYDLVEAHQEAYGDDSLLNWAFLKEWQKKGYLNNIPDDVEVGYILNNAEVIEE